MPRVRFTTNLRQHVDAPECDAAGATVRAVLDDVFAAQPRLKSYVLDDQSRLRKHVSIFVDGQVITDRQRLSDAVRPTSEVFVMQALSGG